MASYGPVVLAVVGDTYTQSARILAIVWEGATTAGDTAEVRSRTGTHPTLWKGRTDTTATYQGINLGPHGMAAPDGFTLAQISAGKVYVYLRED